MTRRTDSTTWRFGLAACALAWALALGFTPALQAAPGAKTYTVPLAQMQQGVDKKFPVRKRLADIIDIQVQSPRLSLLPARNRLGTDLDMAVFERVGGRSYSGLLSLDYGLRFERSDNSVRMTDVRVSGVRLADVPEPYNSLIAQTLPRLAEQLLADYAVHTVSEQEIGLASSLGFEPGALKITPTGLRVTLEPVLFKAAP
ncbi:MAG: hypothetical protein LH479_10890 [Polaromonas sp.]|nr:hypothetical protein [Polaromonas sp.]